MNATTRSSRRSFMQNASAALSVPLAAAARPEPSRGAATVPVLAAGDGDGVQARLARLEDLEAIRALNREFARHVNAGTREAAGALFADPSEARIDHDIREIASDGLGDQDVIDMAPDRRTATAWLECTVHMESAIGPDCPLVEMARQQGGGVVRRTERGVFENVYVRRDGIWKIQRSGYRAG